MKTAIYKVCIKYVFCDSWDEAAVRYFSNEKLAKEYSRNLSRFVDRMSKLYKRIEDSLARLYSKIEGNPSDAYRVYPKRVNFLANPTATAFFDSGTYIEKKIFFIQDDADISHFVNSVKVGILPIREGTIEFTEKKK